MDEYIVIIQKDSEIEFLKNKLCSLDYGIRNYTNCACNSCIKSNWHYIGDFYASCIDKNSSQKDRYPFANRSCSGFANKED